MWTGKGKERGSNLCLSGAISAHFRVCPSVPQSSPGVVSACRDCTFHFVLCFRGLTASLVAQLVKNPPAVRVTWDRSWVEKIPWRRETLPTPVFWPGEFHGLCSQWGRKESDLTEWLSLSLFQICRWYHSNGRKQKGTKEPRDEGERGVKYWLKTQHSKNWDHGIQSFHFMTKLMG